MKKLQLTCAVLASLAACSVANAALTFDADINGGPVAGSTIITFDGLPLGETGGSESGVTVKFDTDGRAVKDSDGTTHAAPWLQGEGNADPTVYLTSGIDDGQTLGKVILTFDSPQSYLGLLWGSVDEYNTLSFYDMNGVNFGAITGGEVIAAAIITLGPGANQVADGSAYVNIFSTIPFVRVEATSTDNYAFEFDNLAVVPEPTTILAGALLLLPFGASAFRTLRKRYSA